MTSNERMTVKASAALDSEIMRFMMSQSYVQNEEIDHKFLICLPAFYMTNIRFILPFRAQKLWILFHN
jgi:hypothetical protein